MLELIQMFEKRGSFIHENLKEIRGLAYKMDSNEINFSGPRKWIEDLDSLPFPARDLMKIKYYLQPREWFSGFYARTLHIMASRGCPYSCSFCSTSMIWGRRFRKFSPRYVIEEIEELINKYKIDGLYFADDTVGIDKKHFTEICNLMVKERIDKKITWFCETRADLIDEDFVLCLKRSGCGLIQFGFE